MDDQKKMQTSAPVVNNGFLKQRLFEAFKEADALINSAENYFIKIVIEK